MMDYHNKEHAKLVMKTFTSLPDVDMTDRDLYNSLVASLHEYDDKIDNGRVLNTMKLIMMQLCENCAEYVEEEKYKRLQEQYK